MSPSLNRWATKNSQREREKCRLCWTRRYSTYRQQICLFRKVECLKLEVWVAVLMRTRHWFAMVEFFSSVEHRPKHFSTSHVKFNTPLTSAFIVSRPIPSIVLTSLRVGHPRLLWPRLDTILDGLHFYTLWRSAGGVSLLEIETIQCFYYNTLVIFKWHANYDLILQW